MNKLDLVAAVAAAAGLTKADADKAVDGLLGAMTTALKDGDEIRLSGFGAFYVKAVPAKEGRNPRTGEKIAIAASRQAKFTAGKRLKDAVNG
ncbi:MAG: HU family DNA-binding protein [Alphaproteobacteria bacterium]